MSCSRVLGEAWDLLVEGGREVIFGELRNED